MGNLFDYLNWRGDLSFQEAPINEVDSLIFSLISYIDLTRIVPEGHSAPSVSIKAAANAFFSQNPESKKISIGVMIPKDLIRLLREVKDTRRFRGVEMRAHVNHIDLQRQMQFSATTFLLDDSHTVVAYRGTDDTLVGWKENFNMSFLPAVPAQLEAVKYLQDAAKQSQGEICLTGHSKGGNLAVYAAIHCDRAIKKRLVTVWSNDGPGFGEGTVNSDAYIEMRPIIKTLVPQSSVVGMLLEHDENYTVVKSRQNGLFQHNGLTWEVMGGAFVHLHDVTSESKRLDKSLNDWIRNMTPEQREQFTESLYQMLSSDNALTVTDLVSLTKNKWIQKSASLDPEVRQTVQKTITALLDINAKNLVGDILKNKKRNS